MNLSKKTISFPELGNYYIPINYLLSHVTDLEVVKSPNITDKTIELGMKYSPDYVCTPFKYNLGNFIECLENGADILIQAGGGCRFGYYNEVQKEILKNLGYKFDFYALTDDDVNGINSIYNTLKKLNPKLNYIKYIYHLYITFRMINYMDKIDIYIRKNIGFEINKGSFDRVYESMKKELSNVKGLFKLRRLYKRYIKKFKNIKIDKPKNPIKVGIIGELYTSMEPFSNYFLEKELAKMNIEITRFTDATYLLFTKRFSEKKLLKEAGDYCKYNIGADGLENVARTKMLINNKYDGILHVKPFGCTPEIGAMKMIQNVCNDYNMPIMFLTFDGQTSELGIKTRLEAFYDMLKMRRDNDE